MLVRNLFLRVVYSILDRLKPYETLHGVAVIRFDEVLVRLENNLGLAIRAAMQPDKLENVLRYLPVLAKAVKHVLNISLVKTYARSCVK